MAFWNKHPSRGTAKWNTPSCCFGLFWAGSQAAHFSFAPFLVRKLMVSAVDWGVGCGASNGFVYVNEDDVLHINYLLWCKTSNLSNSFFEIRMLTTMSRKLALKTPFLNINLQPQLASLTWYTTWTWNLSCSTQHLKSIAVNSSLRLKMRNKSFGSVF